MAKAIIMGTKVPNKHKLKSRLNLNISLISFIIIVSNMELWNKVIALGLVIQFDTIHNIIKIIYCFVCDWTIFEQKISLSIENMRSFI